MRGTSAEDECFILPSTPSSTQGQTNKVLDKEPKIGADLVSAARVQLHHP
jgi:hypothetical protein